MGFDTSSWFLFFAFFGFFAWYWEYKLQEGVEDERLTENRLKATSKAFNISFLIVWLGAVFGNTLMIRIFPLLADISNRYNYVMILIALGFALGLILRSYLTYRYDTKE